MKRLLAALVSLMFAVGCGGDAPTETEGLTPEFAVAGNSGCYTPKFNIAGGPISDWVFEFEVTGDLVGSTTWVFDPASITPTGWTLSNSGTSHWTITGGIIPGLGEFDTEFDNRNQLIDRPGSPGTVFENKGTHKALSDVKKANLTYQGTFAIEPCCLGDWDFQGVICP
jgi:hypothetical protein